VATRLYLPSSSTATPISPAINSNWTGSGVTLSRINVNTIKAGTVLVSTPLTTAATADYCFWQFCSPAINGAQTITGSIQSSLRGSQNTYGGAYAKCIVRSFTSTGTLRSILVSNAEGASQYNSPSLASRILEGNTTITNGGVQDGDYLIIEFGCVKYNAVSATLNLQIGDLPDIDLTATNGDTASNAPWVEFTSNISFKPTPPAPSDSTNGLMLRGIGT